MFNEYEDVITIEELCEMLRIGKNTAYYLVKTKQIKGKKTWKIPKENVATFVQNN